MSGTIHKIDKSSRAFTGAASQATVMNGKLHADKNAAAAKGHERLQRQEQMARDMADTIEPILP